MIAYNAPVFSMTVIVPNTTNFMPLREKKGSSLPSSRWFKKKIEIVMDMVFYIETKPPEVGL